MSEEKQKQINEETLSLAKEYVRFLEAGDSDSADNVLAELTDIRESQLFNELGRLTRDFHETLKSFSADDRFSTLAEDEIPDARERLNYVITKTSDAAHKTLNSVEDALPLCESLEDTLSNLNTEWEKFLAKEMKPQEFRDLSMTIKEFFSSSRSDVKKVRTDLNDILMAQDFQDITGQIITKVITLVTEVEISLVELVKLGSKLGIKTGSTDKNEKKKQGDDASELAGPQIPGMESETIVASQDDVDDLLSSLGF